jgi:hypothetical protein
MTQNGGRTGTVDIHRLVKVGSLSRGASTGIVRDNVGKDAGKLAGKSKVLKHLGDTGRLLNQNTDAMISEPGQDGQRRPRPDDGPVPPLLCSVDEVLDCRAFHDAKPHREDQNPFDRIHYIELRILLRVDRYFTVAGLGLPAKKSVS